MGVRITIDLFICLFSLPRPACTPAVAIRFLQIRLHELHKFLRCGGLGYIAQHTQIHASWRDSEACLQLLQLSAGQISTSGNSQNILYAAVTAKAKGMKVIGLTGAKESKLSDMADVCICVPGTETYKIQELHLPVYHCLCLMLEEEFFGTNK